MNRTHGHHQIENRLIPRSQWQSNFDTSQCNVCNVTIKRTVWRSNKHHCRFCGKIVCGECSNKQLNKNRICTLCLLNEKKLHRSQRKKYNVSKLSSIPEGDECFHLQQPSQNILISINGNGETLEKYNKSQREKWMTYAAVLCVACVAIL